MITNPKSGRASAQLAVRCSIPSAASSSAWPVAIWYEGAQVVPRLSSAAWSETQSALMGDALDLRDAETEGHSKRVTGYAIALAREMGLNAEELKVIARGAFLHDIGKIRELNYARSFSYSTEGHLLGHIIIELELLRDKCREVEGFPAELRMLIEHMLISHHGHYEFGSPKLPMFAEALLLHYLDDMDSKMAAMRSQVARDAEMDSVWTSYNPALSRTVLNVQKYLKK